MNLKNESKKIKDSIDDKNIISNELSDINMSDNTFVHLHNNSQFSVLQSTSRVADLVKKTAELNMSAVALTDKANMMGAFHFYRHQPRHRHSQSAPCPVPMMNGTSPPASL